MKSAKRLNRKLVKSRLTKKRRQVGRGINNFLVTYQKGSRVVKVEGSVNGNNIEYKRISRKDPQLETTYVIKDMDAYLKDLNDTLGGDDNVGDKTLFIIRDSNGVLMYTILTVTIRGKGNNYDLKGPIAFNENGDTNINLGTMDVKSNFYINIVQTTHANINNDSSRIIFFSNNNSVSGAESSTGLSRSETSRRAFKKRTQGRKLRPDSKEVTIRKSSSEKNSRGVPHSIHNNLYSKVNKTKTNQEGNKPPALPQKKPTGYSGTGPNKFTK